MEANKLDWQKLGQNVKARLGFLRKLASLKSTLLLTQPRFYSLPCGSHGTVATTCGLIDWRNRPCSGQRARLVDNRKTSNSNTSLQPSPSPSFPLFASPREPTLLSCTFLFIFARVNALFFSETCRQFPDVSRCKLPVTRSDALVQGLVVGFLERLRTAKSPQFLRSQPRLTH
jgi:hypothetical protein